jgi:hypothetical protein
MSKFLKEKCWPNGLLLTIPPLFFNLLFAGSLPSAFSPEIFDKDIPMFITYGENIFRAFVFLFPIFMVLKLQTPRQKTGLRIYLIGIAIYFASWLVLIYTPESAWSTSLLGFLAPAYTPFIWLLGMSMIGDRTCLKIPYRWWVYLIGVVFFLAFHVSHVFIVFTQNL